MKINAGVQSFHRSTINQESASNMAAGQKSFADYMEQQSQIKSTHQLQEMLRQVEAKGMLLTKSLTVRDLHEYKRMIRRFLDTAIRQGIGVKETKGFNRHGRGKRYLIIDEVDRHLLALTDQLLADEDTRLELLQRIGEIRGLLINLLY